MMNSVKRRTRAALIGTTACLAVLSMTGCSSFRSMFCGSGAQNDSQSAPPIAQDASEPSEDSIASAPARPMQRPSEMAFEAVGIADAPPPTINIFGELDGVQRGTVRTIGEAGFQQHTFVTEGYDQDVAVDPTGRWITFSSTRHSQHPQIYMQRVDGLSVTQLTSDAADNANPVFSPDGKQIAFCSTRAGSWDIYVMDIDGKNAVQVTSGPSQDMHPSFAPDGRRLVYSCIGSRSNQWELWTVDLASSQKRMIGFGLFPSWCPTRDRDQIAFQRARQRGSRWFSLWTLDLVDGEARNVTEVAVSTNAAIVSPSWSPDGRKLAFATIVEPARTSKRGRPEGQQDVWTVNADGTNRHRLTDGNGTNATPYWGPDNRVYFVSDRGGTECVWSSQADASASPMAKKNGEDVSKQSPAIGSTDSRETH